MVWGISDKGFQYVSCGVVKSYEMGKSMEIGDFCYFNPEREILGGMSLGINLVEKSSGTHLHICQDGYRHGGDWDWYYEAVVEAWPMALQHLKNYLEAQ